jgi:DNA-binding response OmpR family regulator
MSQKILVVDDEREIVKLVRTYLEKAAFGWLQPTMDKRG